MCDAAVSQSTGSIRWMLSQVNWSAGTKVASYYSPVVPYYPGSAQSFPVDEMVEGDLELHPLSFT